MSNHGCYGVHIDGVDKLAFNGIDSHFNCLGMHLITELRTAMQNMGYEGALTYWRQKATKLVVVYDDIDIVNPGSIRDILSRGKAGGKENFILNSLWCLWAYILNLDAEWFEIYQGMQSSPHKRGRFAPHCTKIRQFEYDDQLPGFSLHGVPSMRRTEALNKQYYPCALMTVIPLRSIPTFDPVHHLLSGFQNSGTG